MTSIKAREVEGIPSMWRAEWIVPMLLTMAMALGGVAISAYGAYNNNDKATAIEVTTLKTQRVSDKEQLDRLEGKVDKVLEWTAKH